MMIPSVELQKAIFAKLSGSTFNIYEVKPLDASYPFITIGNEVMTDSLTKDSDRTSHNITIHTWSKAKSSLESKKMNHFTKTHVLDVTEVNGFYLDIAKLSMQTTLKEDMTDGTIFHTVLQFEITLTKKK